MVSHIAGIPFGEVAEAITQQPSDTIADILGIPCFEDDRRGSRLEDLTQACSFHVLGAGGYTIHPTIYEAHGEGRTREKNDAADVYTIAGVQYIPVAKQRMQKKIDSMEYVHAYSGTKKTLVAIVDAVGNVAILEKNPVVVEAIAREVAPIVAARRTAPSAMFEIVNTAQEIANLIGGGDDMARYIGRADWIDTARACRSDSGTWLEITTRDGVEIVDIEDKYTRAKLSPMRIMIKQNANGVLAIQHIPQGVHPHRFRHGGICYGDVPQCKGVFGMEAIRRWLVSYCNDSRASTSDAQALGLC